MATKLWLNIPLCLDKLLRARGQRLFYQLLTLFVATAGLFWLVLYCMSPYWHSTDFVRRLHQSTPIATRQLIPEHLLQPNQANLLSTQNLSVQQWQGAGALYLKQVWPKVAARQDPHQLFLLQFNSAPAHSIQRAYTHFPSTFRLTLGNPDNQLWFEWTRQSAFNWQLSQVCFYNPQPVADTNNCSSSSR
ncbi:hypothetical protein ACF3NA_07815 [Alkanindiges sp. WGS2144]|uniref:hypothetical protein n=1 Tax=Alkanindiges sp. WGS2144 TaxID=3366808 RepID=UPI003751EDE2